MFLTPLLTALTEAVKATFDADYPVEEFRNIHIGVDFPNKEQDYPGIWVDFTPTGPTHIAGIDHKEFIEGDNTMRSFTRWTFQGTLSLTVFSFSSLERYRLADEVIRVVSFGKEQAATSQFRQAIESNDFVAINMDFDNVDLRGFSTSQGTPWGGTEFVYEATLVTSLIGEYVTEPATAVLVALSEVALYPYNDQQPDPFANDTEGWT